MGEIYSFQLMMANLFFFKYSNLKNRWIAKSCVFSWTCKLSSAFSLVYLFFKMRVIQWFLLRRLNDKNYLTFAATSFHDSLIPKIEKDFIVKLFTVVMNSEHYWLECLPFWKLHRGVMGKLNYRVNGLPQVSMAVRNKECQTRHNMPFRDGSIIKD